MRTGYGVELTAMLRRTYLASFGSTQWHPIGRGEKREKHGERKRKERIHEMWEKRGSDRGFLTKPRYDGFGIFITMDLVY
jgi:hypothetical protein